MDRALARAVRFRHVVFPDSVGGYGRALNVARVSDEVPAPGGCHQTAHAPAPDFGVARGRPDCVQNRDARGGRHRPATLDADAESFLSGLFGHVGLSQRHYKPETLHRRLPACLRALRATSLAHARSILGRQPHLAWDAVGALVIGVTSFFRDPAVFDALRTDVLPRLVAECRGRRPLRVWSAACSDGAELYSVAMLLREIAGAAAAFDLLGTDCRPAALARAAAGIYDPAAVAGVPPELTGRYLKFDGGRYLVDVALRADCRWRAADVLCREEVPPGPWDLVLCRNLVIYLEPAAASTLWGLLAGALRPGGVLVLGKAERPPGSRGLRVVGPCLHEKGAA
jgi:chemotaxis methyl-accepting protein methylase